MGDRSFHPGQANNFYVCPGLGRAPDATGPRHITDDIIIEAGHALADQVDTAGRARGRLFPPQDQIVEVEITSACRLAEYIFDHDMAHVERPDDIRKWVEGMIYTPTYKPIALE